MVWIGLSMGCVMCLLFWWNCMHQKCLDLIHVEHAIAKERLKTLHDLHYSMQLETLEIRCFRWVTRHLLLWRAIRFILPMVEARVDVTSSFLVDVALSIAKVSSQWIRQKGVKIYQGTSFFTCSVHLLVCLSIDNILWSIAELFWPARSFYLQHSTQPTCISEMCTLV